MQRVQIPVERLNIQPFTAFEPDGILLACGAGGDDANIMTIGWGTFGIMWGKPVAMVMVRPTRHTWSIITKAPDFTINWLTPEWADALSICGTKSGRDINKWEAAGLHPAPAAAVKSPVVAESALVLECRTIYTDTLRPEQFVKQELVSRNYPRRDFHGLFVGEIVQASGTDAFLLPS